MNIIYFKIPAGYKNLNTGRYWQKKIWGRYVTFISVKNFNFDKFILF